MNVYYAKKFSIILTTLYCILLTDSIQCMQNKPKKLDYDQQSIINGVQRIARNMQKVETLLRYLNSIESYIVVTDIRFQELFFPGYEEYLKLQEKIASDEQFFKGYKPNSDDGTKMLLVHYTKWAKSNFLIPEDFTPLDTSALIKKIKEENIKIGTLQNGSSLQEIIGIYNEYLVAKKSHPTLAERPDEQELLASSYSLSSIWNRMTSWYSKSRFKK